MAPQTNGLLSARPTNFGISDGVGGGQDQARKEPPQEVVKRLKAQVAKPARPIGIKCKDRVPLDCTTSFWASFKDKLMPTISNNPFIHLA